MVPGSVLQLAADNSTNTLISKTKRSRKNSHPSVAVFFCPDGVDRSRVALAASSGTTGQGLQRWRLRVEGRQGQHQAKPVRHTNDPSVRLNGSAMCHLPSCPIPIPLKSRALGSFGAFRPDRARRVYLASRKSPAPSQIQPSQTVGSPTVTYPRYHRKKRLQIGACRSTRAGSVLIELQMFDCLIKTLTRFAQSLIPVSAGHVTPLNGRFWPPGNPTRSGEPLPLNGVRLRETIRRYK
jgi:hypothetical protein